MAICVCVCLTVSLCVSDCVCVCVCVCTCLITQLPGGLDVDVVVAAADADDDAQRFELLQVLPGQRDGVVHHGTHRFVQHLRGGGAWQEEGLKPHL